VILVPDLDAAVTDYEHLGFRVTPGGEHADGLTRNALVPFRDGAYLELVSFLDPQSGRDNVWGWREFLPEGGLVDYCATSDDLRAEARRLESLGFGVEGPEEGGRRAPDGAQIVWRSARISQDGRLMPFLIEDVTPPERRVPGGRAADHPNGASGIRRLEISGPYPDEAAASLAALTGTPPSSLALGGCALKVVGGEKAGPAAVELATDAPESGRVLDRGLTGGVRIRLSQGDG
jgi:hypothetical protein